MPRASDVVVSNARDYGTESVAQHTWLLILSLSHRLYEYQTLLKSGAWATNPSLHCFSQVRLN